MLEENHADIQTYFPREQFREDDEANGPLLQTFKQFFYLLRADQVVESDIVPGNRETWPHPQVTVPSGRQISKQRMFAQRKMYRDGLGFMAIFLFQFIFSFSFIYLIKIIETILNFKGPSKHWDYNSSRDDRVIYLLESSFPDRRNLRPRNVTLGPKSQLTVYGRHI